VPRSPLSPRRRTILKGGLAGLAGLVAPVSLPPLSGPALAANKNPVITGLYADPNIAYFNGRYYIYPTTDGFAGWSSSKFTAFSSTDLVNWTNHGTILDLGPGISWADSRAWAPAITQKNGTYYFYFSADTNIGVATSSSPTGPFVDALGAPLVRAGQYSGQAIDPAVFTDTDGTSYLYWGQGTGHVVRLNADMTSWSGPVSDFKPSGYNEAPFVTKRNSTYYLTWSENDTRSEDYQVAYATGAAPTGPWTKRGVILQKDLAEGIKGTGHQSVVKAPDSDTWYIAYHRFAVPTGDGTHRETCIDQLRFNADGTIQKVSPTL
jgi:beta-xylosidase